MIPQKFSSQTDEKEKWNARLAQFPQAGAGHLHQWGEIINAAYGWESIFLAASDSEQIRGLLPLVFIKSRIFKKALVSMPYLNDGGILADNSDTAAFLWSQALEIAKAHGMDYIELRQSDALSLPVTPRTDKISMILDLSQGREDVWMNKIHRNVRNKIRKSEKNGVILSQGHDHLDDFYAMHVMNMHELGSPAHCKALFEEMISFFGDKVRIYAAYKETELIGAKLVLVSNDTLYFLWVSSPRRYMKYAAVSLMDWVAIEDGISLGATECDFGRSTAGSTHYQFKKKWGAQLRQLYWYVSPEPEFTEAGEVPTGGGLQALSKVWKKMPRALVQQVGPRLRGSLPQ